MKLQDQFARPNKDLPGVTPDGWSWVADTGTGTSAWQIRTNRLARKGDSKTSTVYPSKRLVTEDQKFSLTNMTGWTTGSATLWLGLQLRFVDAANYHQVRYNPPTGAVGAQIAIAQVGGAAGNTVTVAIPTPDDGWTMTGYVRRINASTVKTSVSINGVEVATHTSSVAVAWPTTDNGTQGTVKLTGYANSARLNSESVSFFVDDLVIQDYVQPSAFTVKQWNGTTEVPVVLEDAFIEYVVGQADPNYPNGLTEYPEDYPYTW
jgi:hypothetical protein